jgi:hypothetical protein
VNRGGQQKVAGGGELTYPTGLMTSKPVLVPASFAALPCRVSWEACFLAGDQAKGRSVIADSLEFLPTS